MMISFDRIQFDEYANKFIFKFIFSSTLQKDKDIKYNFTVGKLIIRQNNTLMEEGKPFPQGKECTSKFRVELQRNVVAESDFCCESFADYTIPIPERSPTLKLTSRDLRKKTPIILESFDPSLTPLLFVCLLCFVYFLLRLIKKLRS